MALVFKAYTIIERAVEEGVRYGIQRAYKHVDDHPSKEHLETEITQAVMSALNEVIEMDGVASECQ
jgi:hypothetical protein